VLKRDVTQRGTPESGKPELDLPCSQSIAVWYHSAAARLDRDRFYATCISLSTGDHVVACLQGRFRRLWSGIRLLVGPQMPRAPQDPVVRRDL
jgi:hypothetical protein